MSVRISRHIYRVLCTMLLHISIHKERASHYFSMLQYAARRMSSSAAATSALISTEALAARLGGVTILDASWYLPAMARNGKAEYEAKRIPGARFFDIDGVSDRSTSLPHMLPSEEEFADHAARLGIQSGKPVVVYDGAGLFSAARAWWTLKVFGHDDVSVLAGGFGKWESEGRPIETGPVPPDAPPAPKQAWRLRRDLVRDMKQVQASLAAREAAAAATSSLRGCELYVDARAGARFEGSAPEPRAGLSSGHMPTGRSLPFTGVLDGGKFPQLLPADELQAVFAAAGVDLSRPGPIVTSCGSGVTAAVLTLAAVAAGRPFESLALYDGSWTEWAANEAAGCRIVKGPAEPVDPSQV